MSNAMNALLLGLNRLETVGQAGGVNTHSQAIENRVKILDPVRDDWKASPSIIDVCEFVIGKALIPTGGAFTGVSTDWDVIEAVMRMRRAQGALSPSVTGVKIGVSLRGARFIRAEGVIADATLNGCTMRAYWTPVDAALNGGGEWRRVSAYDFSLNDALTYGDAFGGAIAGYTTDNAIFSSPPFEVAIPKGRLTWIPRDIAHTGTGGVGLHIEAY
jgi:hypothetical protein